MPILIPPVVAAGAMSRIGQPLVPIDDDLVLRPWHAEDVPSVVRAFSDPDIQHWHFRSYDAAEAEAWIAAELDGWRHERAASWAIARRDSDAVLGRVAVYTTLKDGHGEVTYWVLPEARGNHVASRAAIAATRWAHQLGLHRVQLQHSTRNLASAGVALRADYISEGIHRESNLHDDGWHDMHVYSHLATD